VNTIVPLGHRGRAVLAALAAALLTACSAALDPALITDAQTAARVKTALVNDPEVGAFTIEVRVAGGVAALSGRVGSEAQAQRALDLARAVPGVTSVRSDLRVGAEPAPPAPSAPVPELPSTVDAGEIDSAPALLAVGAAGGWSIPRHGALKPRTSIGPLIKFGAPRGFGPAIGFDWFQANVQPIGGGSALSRVHVKPLMGGLGYSLAWNRLTMTPSVVGGFAFNSLSVTDTGAASGLPVEVDNSLVWRVGVSGWYDINRRLVLNASMGYIMTGLRLTVLDDGRLEHREVSGDTAIVHVGVAYRIF
jgi:hypothetical protein